jgi:HipA-like C-terminal domain
MSLQRTSILNQSGWKTQWHKYIPVLKKGNYHVVKGVSVGGDAPKDFLRVYEYGEARKSNPKNWTAYIAKVGHKWYPMESVTEHLLNRIGAVLGLTMAFSKLSIINGQIRFCSRYFLKKNEQLMHGAQIYSAFLSGDDHFVETIEQQNQSQTLFTFQFAEAAIKYSFPSQWSELLENFVKLLIFDAIVGNSDRHFYNWGVVTDIQGNESSRFTPIYDTARGLFWNEKEDKIRELCADTQRADIFLKKYVDKSIPKTGWEKIDKLNHFELVKLLHNHDDNYRIICEKLVNDENLNKIFALLDEEFRPLMSKERLTLIKKCLTLRFQQLKAHTLKA